MYAQLYIEYKKNLDDLGIPDDGNRFDTFWDKVCEIERLEVHKKIEMNFMMVDVHNYYNHLNVMMEIAFQSCGIPKFIPPKP